jgi:hypothetical protein
MKTGDLEFPVKIDGTMAVVYDSGELTEAATSITIPELNGDVDEEYELIARIVSGYDGGCNFRAKFNNDGGNNYGYQLLQGVNATPYAERATPSCLFLVGVDAIGHIGLSQSTIQAKSGYVRTVITKAVGSINGTTVNDINIVGQSWDNTVDNMTSIVVYGEQGTGGLGIGSRIILLKKVTATGGMKCGNLEVQGKIYGVWQEIYNHTILGSIYPTQDADHVKATTKYDAANFYPYHTTDPTKSLTGDWGGTQWLAIEGTVTNQRFHIDLGSAQIITRIYYENSVASGILTNTGVQNFTFWGSNSATAFAELTYGTDTNWTQLTTSQSTLDQHATSDTADPKYITVTNTVSYRYYAFKFADNWGHASLMGVRRIELQTGSEGPQTSLTVSSLTGNTDVLYRLRYRIVANAESYVACQPNNDGTANIYGLQNIQGSNTTIVAQRGALSTGLRMGYMYDNHLLFGELIIYAKSGYVRTALQESFDINTTTIDCLFLQGEAWNDVSTQITSLVIGGAANCLDVGTEIVLERLNL